MKNNCRLMTSFLVLHPSKIVFASGVGLGQIAPPVALTQAVIFVNSAVRIFHLLKLPRRYRVEAQSLNGCHHAQHF
ncbi:MAG: hypothetical protein AB2813_11235 [Candidatus Sedimenticola endophacoides]